MKINGKVLCLTILLFFLTACQQKQEQPVASNPTTVQTTVETSENHYDLLEGSWHVAGVYYDWDLIDLSDYSSLQGVYSTYFLIFSKDGTFTYVNYSFYEGSSQEEDAYTFRLKPDEIYTLEVKNGVAQKKVRDQSDMPTFIVQILDENTLCWEEVDPLTGAPVGDISPLIYERDGCKSAYIQQAKSGTKRDQTENSTPTQSPPEPTQSDRTLSSSGPSGNAASAGAYNALQKARDYLQIMPFSYSGLIDQLEYEGFTKEESTYGADHCGADWYEQALLKANNYLELMGFSYSGLIDQLEYEGFTAQEAAYGADHCGADWYEQATIKARDYLELTNYSRSELIDQLIFNGFTQEQAAYGAEMAS